MQNNITLTLPAHQADTLEDAILTFLDDHHRPTFTPIGLTGSSCIVEFAPVQLPQLRQAVASYRQHIEPRDRDHAVRSIGRKLEALA